MPLATAIDARGQRADYTFTATSGQKASFAVTSTHWYRGEQRGRAYLAFYPPGSISTGYECALYDAATTCDITPTTSGTWRVLLTPDGDSLGSMTMTRGRTCPARDVSVERYG